jgi:hypothetical protein
MMEAQRRADDELRGRNDFMSPTEDEGVASD